MTQPLWTPTDQRIAQSNMTRFAQEAERDWNITFDDYDALHTWSVTERAQFWQSLRDFVGAHAQTWGDDVLTNADKMPGAKFFPDARLNYAQNLLRRRDDDDALIFWGEDKVKRRMSWNQLYDRVSQVAQALRAQGVGVGDRVAAVMPNMPETIVAFLATNSLGAIWSSCSPDFGTQGVLDRFSQIEPKVLFCPDGYHYNGKTHDIRAKMAEIVDQLPTLTTTVVVPYISTEPDLGAIRGAVGLGAFADRFAPEEIAFAQMPFSHPIYILFSSGTTGVPKCIVHGAGGALLSLAKEHALHCDVKPNDRVFYFTTCGWMMWNWLVAGLGVGATVMLYDGSPFYPDGNILFDYAQAEKFTLFGTSAKYIDALKKADLRPGDSHDLSTVRTMASTGSPLAPESFDYVYDAIKADVHLASIAGGTDIAGCFMLGNPNLPVWRGEIQIPALAMKVEVFDDAGQPVAAGEKGELVCTRAFPTMPVRFWNDENGEKYHEAYFAKFPNVWCHGDYIAMTEHGGVVVYGRSDATLNPGGVRIGTAEIYRQVEKLDAVVEGIVIGQEWDNDTRVVLFVVLRPGMSLDDRLEDKIRRTIRQNCTPRHVPARIVQVSDIPRTKSGKITELAVRDVVHGRAIKNKEALANPEALELFRHIDALQS